MRVVVCVLSLLCGRALLQTPSAHGTEEPISDLLFLGNGALLIEDLDCWGQEVDGPRVSPFLIRGGKVWQVTEGSTGTEPSSPSH